MRHRRLARRAAHDLSRDLDTNANRTRMRMRNRVRVTARTSRLFSLFSGYVDKKLKVQDYAINTT